MKKYIAEMLGTMVLVLMGCGTAVSLSCTSANPDLASTVVGTALAFGLAVVAMAFPFLGKLFPAVISIRLLHWVVCCRDVSVERMPVCICCFK